MYITVFIILYTSLMVSSRCISLCNSALLKQVYPALNIVHTTEIFNVVYYHSVDTTVRNNNVTVVEV